MDSIDHQLGPGAGILLLRQIVGQHALPVADEMTHMLVDGMAAQYGEAEVVRRIELAADLYLDFHA